MRKDLHTDQWFTLYSSIHLIRGNLCIKTCCRTSLVHFCTGDVCKQIMSDVRKLICLISAVVAAENQSCYNILVIELVCSMQRAFIDTSVY